MKQGKSKFSFGKIGGTATAGATIIIALTAGWNSIKEFMQSDEPKVQQKTQIVQDSSYIEQNKKLEEQLAEMEQRQKEAERQKETSKTQSTTPATTKNTDVTTKTQTSVAQNTMASNTSTSNATKDIKAEKVSFDGGGLSAGTKVKYTVVNNSSTVSYKDIVFEVAFLDRNNTVLAKEQIRHQGEVFAPNSKQEVQKSASKTPDGTQYVGLKTIKATPVR